MKTIVAALLAVGLLTSCLNSQQKTNRYMTSQDSMSARSDSIRKMGRTAMDSAERKAYQDTGRTTGGDTTH